MVDAFSPAPVGGVWIVDRVSPEGRRKREEFYFKLREEWRTMWRERFDDKDRAEGVTLRDYPLIFLDQGSVIYASRGVKSLNFFDILQYWESQGFVYAPEPSVGGWRKFIKTFIKASERHMPEESSKPGIKKFKQQLKKGGRGWLHMGCGS